MMVSVVSEVWSEETSILGFLGLDSKEIKVWTTKYPNGEVKEEYQYYNHPENNKRIKDGWYNSYYDKGESREVGKYIEGKKDGEWVDYYRNGKFDGKNVGYVDGKITIIENYKNGKRDGKWKEYSFTGTYLVSERNYEDGKLDGKWVLYNENGKIVSEKNYKDGERID